MAFKKPAARTAQAPAQAAADAAPAAEAKRIEAFYTQSNSANPQISLWVLDNPKGRGPIFNGKIGEQMVNVFLRHNDEGVPFLGIAKFADKDADGNLVGGAPVGTANIVTNSRGLPRLAIKMEGYTDTVWASVSKRAPQDLLVRCGLNLERMQAKRQEHEASQAAKAAQGSTEKAQA